MGQPQEPRRTVRELEQDLGRILANQAKALVIRVEEIHDLAENLHFGGEAVAYRDDTTDVVFERLDFMARLTAPVPSPRVNLTRYHGVFAPKHRLREQVTPARRGRRGAETTDEPAPAPHVLMTWAKRLKRFFLIDIEICEHCGGAVKVIASIEEPAVTKQILDHLARRAEAATPVFRPFGRAPPPQELPGLEESR